MGIIPSPENIEDLSVVQHPKLGENGQLQSIVRFGSVYRGPLLPAWGSRERERALRRIWHHDYNTIFRGAIIGVVKKVQSTPWEVTAPSGVEYWQKLLMSADFGDWDRFLAKIIVDNARHDTGAFIELIGPGDPKGPIAGPVMGMAVLDSLLCHPTGIPEYPIIYYDIQGRLHILHRSRIVQFIDSPDSDESVPGYGDCALSRAIAPVWRQILMGRYVEQFLDDKPPPGLMILGGLSKEHFEQATAKMLDKQRMDEMDEWGRTVILQSLDASVKPSAEFIDFHKIPEKFDFERYTLMDVREIALAIGLDIQDVWELSGQGIGTGTQSEVLAQKSRGKAIGRILKGLERMINRALPEDVEFKWKYEDPNEDAERAAVGQTVATTLQIASGVLTPDEQRQVLANEIESIGDVLRAPDGTVTSLADADPKAPGQTPTISPVDPDALVEPSPETAGDAAPMALSRAVQPVGEKDERQKDFIDTALEFYNGFVAAGRRLLRGESDGRTVGPSLRRRLYDTGVLQFVNGLKSTGVKIDSPNELEVEEWNTINDWYITESNYLSGFLEDLYERDMSDAELTSRAEMWVNKSIRRIMWEGVLSGDRNGMYEYRLGNAEEHCRSCLVLNGQRHRMRDWMRNRIYPGSDRLLCKGFECDCRFVRVEGRAQGRFRSVPLSG